MGGPRQVSAAVRTPLAAESEDFLLRLDRQKRANLRQYLGIGVVELGNCVVGAFANAAAAAVTLGGDDFRSETFGVVDRAVRTGARADAACLIFCANAAVGPDYRDSRFDLPTVGMENARGAGSSR